MEIPPAHGRDLTHCMMLSSGQRRFVFEKRSHGLYMNSHRTLNGSIDGILRKDSGFTVQETSIAVVADTGACP